MIRLIMVCTALVSKANTINASRLKVKESSKLNNFNALFEASLSVIF